MSLRTFHVLFVSASLLLAVLVLAWSVASGEMLMASLTAVLATVLGLYCAAFVRKLRSDSLEAEQP